MLKRRCPAAGRAPSPVRINEGGALLGQLRQHGHELLNFMTGVAVGQPKWS